MPLSIVVHDVVAMAGIIVVIIVVNVAVLGVVVIVVVVTFTLLHSKRDLTIHHSYVVPFTTAA